MTRDEAKEIALAEKAIRCWVRAGEERRYGVANHCTPQEVPGRSFWTLLNGDYMVLGGQRIPLSSDITPCDAHLSEFEEAYP